MGLEPTIFGSGGRRLIHYATGARREVFFSKKKLNKILLNKRLHLSENVKVRHFIFILFFKNIRLKKKTYTKQNSVKISGTNFELHSNQGRHHMAINGTRLSKFSLHSLNYLSSWQKGKIYDSGFILNSNSDDSYCLIKLIDRAPGI